MENVVKNFFDQKASNWDNLESKTEEWLTNFIDEHVPLKKGMKVLDLGCGTGIISGIIYNQTKQMVTGMDVSSDMVDIARLKYDSNYINFVIDDFYNTKVTDMDMIICFNAYPHFVDIDNFVKKSYEVLSKNGTLVILHNLSRADLVKCHNGIHSSISRDLSYVEEEVKPYLKLFDAIELVDNNEMFKMILKKK